MIKKLLGVVVAAAVVAVIVATVLHRDKYRSMVFDDGFPGSLVPTSILRPTSAASTGAPAADETLATEAAEAAELEAQPGEAADSVAETGTL